MNNVEKWIAALRSGKYKQDIGALRTTDGYCCLGVACDLHRKEHPQTRWKKCRSNVYLYEKFVSHLPNEVIDWLGIGGRNIFMSRLIGLNDGGAPFTEIADYIEAALPVLQNLE